MVALSESACHKRVARLKSLGVIRGERVLIELPQTYGFVRVLTLLILELQNETMYQRLNNAILNNERIVRAHRVSGEYDYALETIAPDFETYRQTVETLVNGGFGIARYQSRILQEEIKDIHPCTARLIDL